jgi:hypothetical protein
MFLPILQLTLFATVPHASASTATLQIYCVGAVICIAYKIFFDLEIIDRDIVWVRFVNQNNCVTVCHVKIFLLPEILIHDICHRQLVSAPCHKVHDIPDEMESFFQFISVELARVALAARSFWIVSIA